MKFLEAIQKFKDWRNLKVGANTVKGYDLSLRQLCVHLHNPDIEAITLDQVIEYLNGLRACGWDGNSLIPRCTAIRKILEFYRRQGFACLDPELIPIPPKDYKLPRVCDYQTLIKLLAAIPESNDPRHIRNRAMIHMFKDTGARNGELLDLNVADLSFEERGAIVKTEKNKGSRPYRRIYWTETTQGHLLRWMEKRERLKAKMDFKDPDALFVSICGSRHDTQGRRFTIKGVGEMLRHYSDKAGIPTVNAHSLRHYCGHDIIKNGGSTADVMNILGHASVQSTTIYTAMAGNELKGRWEKLLAGR